MEAQECVPRHRVAVDAAIAVSFMVLDTGATLAGASWWPAHPGPLAWTLLAVQAAVAATLFWRRRAPVLVVVILAAFTLVLSLLIWPGDVLTPAHQGTVWAPYATVLAAYGPFFYRQDRRAAFVSVGILALVVARPWHAPLTVITIGLLRTAGGPLVALYFDARRRLVRALRDRAERAEQEQYLLAEQARDEERARLAAEMHDVVTHRVSLMVLQAGALEVTAADDSTRQAARQLRAAGCQALDELRDLVGILRTAPQEEPAPPTSGLAALVAESTSVGTPAELMEDGDPALASPVVGRTAYRVVREALTNVRKHAPGATATVRIGYAPSGVRLVVSNTPPPGLRPSDLAATGSGLGLAGLRQRIDLVHGTLASGPTADGGFCLEATLPAYVPTAALVDVPADVPAAVPAAERTG